MITLLVLILGLNIYGFFLKNKMEPPLKEEIVPVVAESIKTSKECVNLDEIATFQCLNEVFKSGGADGNDHYILGQMYLYGLGTERDGESALKLLERSAFEYDNNEARVLLGDLLIDVDPLSGKYWYSQALQRGSVEGLLKLANYYRYSEEDANPVAAFNLYQSAANQGVLPAQYELAVSYAMGIGVDPNIDRAVQILESTCDQKHENSCVLLNRIKELQAESN